MQTFIEYKSKKIYYTVSRRKRRTIGISVSVDKGVELAVPYKTSEHFIHQVVERKASWILEKLDHLHNIRLQTPVKSFVDGDTFLLMGRDYRLNVLSHKGKCRTMIELSTDSFIVKVPQTASLSHQPDIIREALIKCYKNKAKELIGERVALFSEKLGVKASGLIIKGQKTIWGSCTKDNKININWKILMAPLSIIDYLVVHELAHIRMKNHSRNFWGLVETILPNYKESVKWLKQNGHKLHF